MTVIFKPAPVQVKRYGTIISDPPWYESGGGKIKRGADRWYELMRTDAICALGKFVQSVADHDAHLYLWITNNFLQDGFKVLEAWGFKYVTLLTWEKEGKAGLGQYFRGRTEHVMFARRGCPPYRTNPATGRRAQGVTSFETVDPDLTDGAYFKAPRGAHSQKPMQIHEWAELVSPGPRLEMFCRGTPRQGWDGWGMETVNPISTTGL